ncbi:hypothetical protein GCM10009122_58720 [Fulvivirga kasyanovii]|uniref:Uncharacterized protein n=1 Tax=Fulvivirga kasyanovii TaxID=396812 RepID=A0ABW9RY83_9BACT|nr:hypothetical protein [Fulvivirga kasyanovii]MTI27965.1 hypothetical protein [Fulvivirga kasyanovii]
MSKKKAHGERNKTLSHELLEGKKYYDWVITTAFYSAIHFVEDKILPCEISSRICNNISEVKAAYKMNGRHSSRERLVFDHFPIGIAVKYKWLDDKSRYSRYTTFKVTPTEADKAQQYLLEIHEACYDK